MVFENAKKNSFMTILKNDKNKLRCVVFENAKNKSFMTNQKIKNLRCVRRKDKNNLANVIFPFSLSPAMDNGHWTIDNGQCTMHNAQCTMHNAQ